MKPLSVLIETLTGKRIAVIGMGVSNTPLISFLLSHDISVNIRDKQANSEQKAEFEALGATFITGEHYLEHLTEEVIFRTPGLSPRTPELLRAKENGAHITSEMQEFFHLCPCPVIAVTGSDGKTTTTTLIAKFLQATEKKVFIGGNIGTPLLCQVNEIKEHDVAVVELSSFQLMDLDCTPHVAVLTNLSPNHLDYHGTMEEYVTAKTNIFTKQTQQQTLIMNADNPESVALCPTEKGSVRFFSRQESSPKVQAFLEDSMIKTSSYTLPLHSIHLKGVHNIENYMAAMLAVQDFCSQQDIEQVAREFYGVEHRMEFVREKNGVSYYNDSIGTSPTRTIAGLHSFEQRVILIAGGYDKGIPFDQLGHEIIACVKHLILVGDTSKKIEESVNLAKETRISSNKNLEGTFLSTTICKTLQEAVDTATTVSASQDIILLSPACAAFDQFKNFAERGNIFKEIVSNL